MEDGSGKVGIAIRWIGLDTRPTSESHVFRMAGESLSIAGKLLDFLPFRIAGSQSTNEGTSSAWPPGPFEKNLFDGVGWVASSDRSVRCSSGADGYHLTVERVAEFSISSDGREILVRHDGEIDPYRLAEALLGPALLLALALRGKFCLHASAVAKDGVITAFLGDSGAGKSTLADRLALEDEPWSIAGDDLLMVSREEGRFWACPHFPQPSLGNRQQRLEMLPERMPLDRVYLLVDPLPEDSAVEVSDLSPKEALATLSRHSVASRLFDQDLMRRHFLFFADLVGEVEVGELRYPRSYSVLPAISRLLA